MRIDIYAALRACAYILSAPDRLSRDFQEVYIDRKHILKITAPSYTIGF